MKGYAVQGVTGVRFQFGICGAANSTALTGCRQYSSPLEEGTGIAVREAWVTNLQTFLGDIRAAGLTHVTPTPALHGFGGDQGTYYRKGDGSCYTFPDFGISTDPLRPGATPPTPIEWWPASPYAVVADDEHCPRGDLVPGPHLYNDNASYGSSPENEYNFAGWNNLFEVFRRVLVAVATTPGLTLREFDLTNEFDLTHFPVQGRLIYDNHRNIDVFTEVQNKVAGAGFDRKLVTFSVSETNPTVADWDCGSVYGDSARVITMSSLFAGLRGGRVGRPSVDPTANLLCSGSVAGMIGIPGLREMPSIADMHATPCRLSESTGRCDPNDSVDSIKIEAKRAFNGVKALLNSYCSPTEGGWRKYIPWLCNATFIQGEVAAKKEPPVCNIREDGLASNCDGSPSNAPEGSARGFNESELAGRSAVIRPWVDAVNAPDDGVVRYGFPHNLRRTFTPQP